MFYKLNNKINYSYKKNNISSLIYQNPKPPNNNIIIFVSILCVTYYLFKKI
jgi:hypothetical protein